MFVSILRRLLSAFMSVILFFNSVSIDVRFIFEDVFKMVITYTFSDQLSGSASGTVTVKSRIEGKYDLYWGDSQGRILTDDIDEYTASYSEFATVDVDDGEGKVHIQEFTYIPEDAGTVIAYKGDFKCAVTDIPHYKQTKKAEPLYSFGVLSDVHFGRYSALFSDVAELTFPNALNFFEKLDVSAVAISGDISNSGEKESFIKYRDIVSDYSFPVFTVTGNHDVGDDFTLENWNRYINAQAYTKEGSGVLSVAENSLDFTYSVPGTDDVFIFFNQIDWEYGDPLNDRLVTDRQLDWLKNQLEKHKNQTVYLFFHTFTSDTEGNPLTGCGNLANSQGTTYDLVFTLGAADEIRFTAMLKEYKNVIYFSGHSHWAFDMQKYNPKLNITDYDGTAATSVHVSSVSAPRRVSDQGKEIKSYNMSSSEGYYVEVYEDCIVLRGVDFFKGQFLSYSVYRIKL